MSCGSVWGLRSATDLNGASCKPDLLGRLTLVAAVLGVGGVAGGLALATRGGHAQRGTFRSRALLVAALLGPVILFVVVVIVGRHLVWSVSGA
jgi:hypothetical protein